MHIFIRGCSQTCHADKVVEFHADDVFVDREIEFPQRQDSTKDQLIDVIGVANAMGCYDAADAISRILPSYR